MSIQKGFSSMANAKGVGMALFTAIVVFAVFTGLTLVNATPARAASEIKARGA